MLPETPPAAPTAPQMYPVNEGAAILHVWTTVLLVVIGMGLISAGLAQRKGYNPVAWVFASGAIAWVFLALLPDVSATGSNAVETLQARNRGNLLGVGLTILSVFIGLSLWLLLPRK